MILPPRKMNYGEQLTVRIYNELLDYVRRITPIQGENVRIDYKASGAVIHAQPQNKGTITPITPFTVRRHIVIKPDEKNTDNPSESIQWEVFIPQGAAAYGINCAPMNRKANQDTAHEADGDDWYQFSLPDEPGTHLVNLHIKGTAQIEGVDSYYVWDKPYCYVDSTKQAEKKDSCAGDILSQTIAVVRINSTDDGKTTTVIDQIATTQISLTGEGRTLPFSFVWRWKIEDGGEATLSNVYVVRNKANIAGYNLEVEGDSFVDVTNKKFVYCKITATVDLPYTIEIIAGDEINNSNSDIYTTFILLWELEENCVVGDYRENLNRALYYR